MLTIKNIESLAGKYIGHWSGWVGVTVSLGSKSAGLEEDAQELAGAIDWDEPPTDANTSLLPSTES